ncbi:class I SAM-dependent methyltransferase [Desulforhopalus sp. 52FAK]
MKISVSSTIKSATFLQKAENLAIKLDLIFCQDPVECITDILLCYTPEGLQLMRVNATKNKLTKLLFVDFIHGKNGYRRKNNTTTKQPLAKAVGIKPGYRPSVFDATAGLGGDSFVLATLGCKVTMCERNPIMAELLSNGLKRALRSQETEAIVKNNLTLLQENSLSLTKNSIDTFETVYLDPMYPHETSSALNKKEMRVIRMIVGDDLDSSDLLECARKFATKRIVVKRPRLAPPLSEEKISYQLKMKSSRYDVYILT